jgi:hypothetical protein
MPVPKPDVMLAKAKVVWIVEQTFEKYVYSLRGFFLLDAFVALLLGFSTSLPFLDFFVAGGVVAISSSIGSGLGALLPNFRFLGMRSL